MIGYYVYYIMESCPLGYTRYIFNHIELCIVRHCTMPTQSVRQSHHRGWEPIYCHCVNLKKEKNYMSYTQELLHVNKCLSYTSCHLVLLLYYTKYAWFLKYNNSTEVTFFSPKQNSLMQQLL